MNIEEMKLAVCEKLPELIHVHGVYALDGKQHPYWRINGAIIHWPTEGLAVCHEAEKLLQTGFVSELGKYIQELNRIGDRDKINPVFSTYEQRLEALCRVWWPEKFKE